MTETIEAKLFDHPKYYDLIYRAGCNEELAFLLACFDRHAGRPVRRIFEPACGTGRLLVRLARCGFEVAGNDLNSHAVRYCNDRLARHGFPRSARVGDMAAFRVPQPADAAFNLINSFRHLLSEAAAISHLRCVAGALARGGLYLLGLHLTPTRGPVVVEDESWSARRGRLSADLHMWTRKRDVRRRREVLGLTIDVATPARRLRIRDEMHYRTYTAPQVRRLLADVPRLEVVQTFDFCYEVDHPIVVGPETEDVIYVLRKR